LPDCLHGPEASRPSHRIMEDVDVELDHVDLLHAPDVPMSPLLVCIDEGAGALDASGWVDDFVAVDLAPSALGLLLRPERQQGALGESSLHTRIVGEKRAFPQVLT
jgi:hypothetical protein